MVWVLYSMCKVDGTQSLDIGLVYKDLLLPRGTYLLVSAIAIYFDLKNP